MSVAISALTLLYRIASDLWLHGLKRSLSFLSGSIFTLEGVKPDKSAARWAICSDLKRRLTASVHFQTHPQETWRGNQQLCQWLSLQARSSSRGEHGPEALGPPGLPAAPEPGCGPETGDAAGRADWASCMAQRPLSAVWSLPSLAWYSTISVTVFITMKTVYCSEMTYKRPLLKLSLEADLWAYRRTHLEQFILLEMLNKRFS